MAAVLLLLLLAACADDDGDRRFANEPPPTGEAQPTATTAVAAVTPEPTTEPLPVVSPQALLVSPGAPNQYYVQADNRLLAFAPGSGPTSIFELSDGVILAIAPSPSGDRVATLIAPTADTRSIVILSAAGEEVRRVDGLEAMTRPATATPVPDESIGRDTISWSTQGDQLLIGFATGGIAALPVDGEPAALLSPDQAAVPLGAAWSPAGNAIAFINRPDPNGSAGLYVAPSGRVPLDPVPVVPPSDGPGRSVDEMAWLPDGQGILYTQTAPDGSLPQGGDLFQISSGGGQPRFIASASRAGPVAAIAHFSPSPDGRAVAFTVVIPGDSGPRFHSLWLEQVGAATSRSRLDVPPGQAVTDLWWTTEGLAWRTVEGLETLAYASGPFSLYRAGADGQVVPVYAAGAPADATPVASPQASPDATPVGSPEAAADAG